jgi:hypothetical protein
MVRTVSVARDVSTCMYACYATKDVLRRET